MGLIFYELQLVGEIHHHTQVHCLSIFCISRVFGAQRKVAVTEKLFDTDAGERSPFIDD
jgi:hypothetical protein